MNCWHLLSRVPGTKQHRTYCETADFVDDINAFMREQFGSDYPLYPTPIPRYPWACRLALEAMQALLLAVKVGYSGGNAVAVFEEHMPVLS